MSDDGSMGVAAKDWLTLQRMLEQTPLRTDGGEVPVRSLRVVLVRHSFTGDRAILRKHNEGRWKRNRIDIDDPGFPLRSAEEKLVALRMRPKLVEAFSAEQYAGAYAVGGERAELVIAFAAGPRGTAELLGAFRVADESRSFDEFREHYESELEPLPQPLLDVGFAAGWRLRGLSLSAEPGSRGLEYYRLEPAEEVLAGLSGRLVIDWPLPYQQWVRRIGAWKDGPDLDAPVVEIRAPGFVMPFPGVREVDLSWDELHALMQNEAGNPEWVSRLSSVRGVYLITDHGSDEGRLYVGAATGGDGVWGRWRGYAKEDGHNGNKSLVELMADNPRRNRQFRFSLLEVMGRTTGRKEVLAAESRWKRHLGSRAFGLNEN